MAITFKTLERYSYGWTDSRAVYGGGGNSAMPEVVRDVLNGTYVNPMTAAAEEVPLEAAKDFWRVTFGDAIEYDVAAGRLNHEPEGMLIAIAARLTRAKLLVYRRPIPTYDRDELMPAMLYLLEKRSADS